MATQLAPRHRPRGFTLIEIVISMVLLSILGIVGAQMFSGSVYTNQTISNTNMAYASARYAMERMAREVREMDNSTGSLQITSSLSQSQTLTFKKTGPQGQTTVTFTFNNGTLSMAYGNGTSHTLATNLSEGAFSYYTAIGANSATTTTDPSTLHFVFIRLKVQPDPALSQTFTFSNLIYLHNT
jgi:prepilin-type N-terminal cleavage/methylation domain-containing protein